MNIVQHVSLLHVEVSSGCMPKSGIARSSGSTISNFLRNLQTDLQSGFTSVQSHQQWNSVPFSPKSSLASAVLLDFHLSHSDPYEVEFQCCFNLYFPDN